MRITIFGGTGFVGRYLVAKLAQHRHLLRIATRSLDTALFLKPFGELGQITPVAVDYHNPASLYSVIQDTDCVINLIGTLTPSGKEDFNFVHTLIPQRIAEACVKLNVPHMVHLSALGIQNAPNSLYARSKLAGERAILDKLSKQASIMRPSLIFGPEDKFFNRYAQMARLLPFIPMLGSGKNRFQPVYVGDVAQAITHICNQVDRAPTPKKRFTSSGTYELGGENIYDMKTLIQKTLCWIGRQKPIIPLPLPLAKVIGWGCQILPNPPFIPDHLELLKHDNVVNLKAHTLQELGVTPTPLELIVPKYLQRFHAKS